MRTLHIPEVHFRMKLRSWYATMWYTPTWRYATMWYTRRIAVFYLPWEFYFMTIALFVQKLHALKQTLVFCILILTFNHLECSGIRVCSVFPVTVTGGHGNGHCGCGIIHKLWQVSGSSASPSLGERFGFGTRVWDWICPPAILAGVHYQIPLFNNALFNNGI